MSLFAAIDATWPAEDQAQIGGVTLRHSDGGGKRVTAATASDDVSAADLDAAIAQMAGQGRAPLFQLRGMQPRLDAMLDARGFAKIDETTVFDTPCAPLAGTPPPPVSAFTTWPPLAIQAEIWADGGIGPDRIAVMDRVRGPKTSLIGRIDNAPAGAAFVALGDGVAVLHALHVLDRHRRKGCAANLIRGAAIWAHTQGARRFATLTLRDNLPAQRLMASLGMHPVEHYHYRLFSN